jgi:hypothetical protein
MLGVPLLGILLFAGTSAHGGLLLDATWTQVTQGFPMTRTRFELGATGSSIGTSFAVGLSYPFLSTNFFVPKTPNSVIDLAIHITQGGPQVITATAGMLNASPGVPGTVVVRTALHNAMGLNQSMFKVGINTLLAVPLSNGRAGQFTGTFTILAALHYVTVEFYAWARSPIAFTGLTTKGIPLPDVTAPGSEMRTTVHGDGWVTLVSPSKISIDGALAQRRSVTFSTLRLVFPEPETWLLLAAAALGMGLIARRTRG